MFTALRLIPILALYVAVATAEDTPIKEDAAAKDPIAELIKSIPRQELLEQARTNVRDSTNEKLKDYHRSLLDQAAESIPKLRAILRPGTSVFGYPGLLALGRITYHGTAPKEAGGYQIYRLYIGFFMGAQGVGKYDFAIIFDEKGMIHEIESVSWKK